MENPSFSSTLYDCATECALRRRNRHCREQFGGAACNYCSYNVNRYIDADPRHVELFMLQAETRAGAIYHAGRQPRIIFLILIALVAFAVWTGHKANQKREAAYRLPPQNTTLSAKDQATIDKVNKTLDKVAVDLNRKVDVNSDGKINCIDAAVLFYKHYPNREEICIVLNVNNATGMNHLFNAVPYKGGWGCVEPQSYWHNNNSIWVKDVWGNKYNSKYNVDVTAEWSKYVK